MSLALNAALTAIDAGMENGQRYSDAGQARERAAWRVVERHCPDRNEAQCREIIRRWSITVRSTTPNMTIQWNGRTQRTAARHDKTTIVDQPDQGNATTVTYTHANCSECGEHRYIGPLHGERGGPLFCLLCSGKWHAEHGRRWRAGRVVIKALKAYEAAGGSLFGKDFDQLKLVAGGVGHIFGYEADTAGADFSDLTLELLDAAVALTHPDKHPLVRKEQANWVTADYWP